MIPQWTPYSIRISKMNSIGRNYLELRLVGRDSFSASKVMTQITKYLTRRIHGFPNLQSVTILDSRLHIYLTIEVRVKNISLMSPTIQLPKNWKIILRRLKPHLDRQHERLTVHAHFIMESLSTSPSKGKSDLT